MRPNWSFSVRLDEFFYFLTWPLVYLLGFTKITPNQLALFSLGSGIWFLAGLYQGLLSQEPQFLALLLIIRVLLDCADGQLARYTRQTSSLGALYDLVADFLFAVALFALLGRSLIRFGDTDANVVILVCTLALICFLTSTTVFSYLAMLERSSDLYPAEVRKRFISPLPNDRPGKSGYAIKLKLLNLLFSYTWRLVSYLSILLVLSPEKTDLHPSALRIMAPLEYGMQLTILAAMILFQVNLVYYLIFEITAFFVLLLLLLYHYKE